MRRMTKQELETCRHEFENGLPIAAIAKKYGIGYNTLWHWKKKAGWKPWRRLLDTKPEPNPTSASKAFRKDDRGDLTLIDSHLSEWRTIRRMLQQGVDHNDRSQVDFVQACANIIATVQDRERELRGLRTKGRLKVLALRPPPTENKAAPSPGRFTPKIRRPGQVHPNMATSIISMDDLLRVWMPSDPPASVSHRRHWISHIEAFCAFVGHRDPRLVTREDAFRWRDALIRSGLTPRTVHQGRIAAMRALFQYAVHADMLSDNPFANIVYRYDPRPFQRRGFSAEEARTILIATLHSFARQQSHTRSVRRWVPWLCAFTGARVGEVMQLRKSDVKIIDEIPVMVIDPEAGPVKGYVGRSVPLHPQLIEQGFLEFASQRPDGYLFADDGGRLIRFATAQNLGKWIRSLGVTDRKLAPLHSFRHRFKSVAREAGLAREYHEAITGHRAGRTRGDDYGEVPLKALYREILKLPRINLGPQQ